VDTLQERHTIRPLWDTESDSPVAETARQERALASLLARAFRDNPMNRAVLRRSPQRRERANRLSAQLLVAHAREFGHVLIDGDSPRNPLGALIGFDSARLVAPSPPVFARLWLVLRQGLGTMGRWGRVQSELEKHRPKYEHWTLSMVGVAPSEQGKGIGAALVADWLAEVDRAGGTAYVETDRAELLPFYQRFGFVREIEATIFDVDVFGLVRPARSDRPT
jgi:GNAT superfamily N-acetyltransferase